MGDFNSSLPVRTQTAGDIQSILVDYTNPTTQGAKVDTHGSQWAVIANAAGTATTSQVNGSQQALDVGINVAGIQIDPRLAGQYNTVLPTLTNGQFTAPQTDINGRLLTVPETDIFPATQTITAQDTATTSTVSGNQTFYTGVPTAGSFATFTLSSNETVMLETTGTWTGTLQAEVSVDGGTTWVARSIHLIGSPNFVSNFTTNVIGSGNVAAKTNFRVRATAAWTGTATIKVNLSVNASTVYVGNAIKLVDASSPLSTIQATIKAASTAAVATDTALVVAISPNNTIAVTQSTSPWITKDQADGPVTPGTVASFSQLIGGQYNTALPTLTNGQQSAIQLDSSGRLFANVTNLPTTVDTNFGTVGASTIRVAAEPGNATGIADFNNGATSAQTLRVAANLAVAGANVTALNPIPVTVVSTVLGTNINKYNTTANVAIGGTTNHNYTITALKTFTGKMFWISASGKIRADVQTSPDGTTFTTFWTGFNSTSDPNISINLDLLDITDSGTGAVIRIVITNRDLAVFDVFSTISGIEN